MKGCGKTSMVRLLVAPCRRAIFADPEGKWEPQHEADVIVYGQARLFAFLQQVDAANPDHPFRVIYRDDADVMATAAPAAAFAYRNCTLVIDEMAWLTNAWNLPVYLKRILQYGRQRRVNVVGTTRIPQEIHDFFFSTADLVLVFHTEPGNGLDRLARKYPQLAAVAGALPPLRFVAHRADPATRAEELLGLEGHALLP